MASKHPNRYAVMLMVSKNDYKFLDKYRPLLDPHVEFYMKEETFDDIAPQHVSLCYFSYEEKYPKEYIKKLIPKIKKIAKKFAPIKVTVKGLLGGWEMGWDFPVIMWNIENLEEINKFHNELISALKEYIEHFNDSELNFEPHIGIALAKRTDLPSLKEIVKRSKNDRPVEINLDRITIFFPDGPEEIMKLND